MRLLVSCALAGCASAQHQSVASHSTASAPVVGGRRNLIAAAEIGTLAGTVQTAYGIVERLRPDMLRSQTGLDGELSAGYPFLRNAPLDLAVFLDDQRLGDTRSLQDISRLRVLEIRYLAGPDASAALGVKSVIGAIQVISKP